MPVRSGPRHWGQSPAVEIGGAGFGFGFAAPSFGFAGAPFLGGASRALASIWGGAVTAGAWARGGPAGVRGATGGGARTGLAAGLREERRAIVVTLATPMSRPMMAPIRRVMMRRRSGLLGKEDGRAAIGSTGSLAATAPHSSWDA